MSPESYDDLIGKPYKPHATGPNAFDCWGLCVEVLKRLGIFDHLDLAGEILRGYCPETDDPGDLVGEPNYNYINEPRKAGDILILRGDGSEGSRATHAAIHIGRRTIIQCTKAVGVHLVPYRVLEPYTVEIISWTD